MITRNQAAFLDMLGVSEGTSTHPLTRFAGYDVIVTGIDERGRPTPEVFTDFSDHPFARGRPPKRINSRGLNSTASDGKFQILIRDWAHYKALLKLPDFGPDSQRLYALLFSKSRPAIAGSKASVSGM